MSAALDAVVPSGWIPEDPQEAWEIGNRMAEQVSAHQPRRGGDRVEELAAASLPLLRKAGIAATIVRSRPNCLVVRSAVGSRAQAASACALVNGWLEALPQLAHQSPGTVVESSCANRNGDVCVYALMWQDTLAPMAVPSPPRPSLPSSADRLPATLAPPMPPVVARPASSPVVAPPVAPRLPDVAGASPGPDPEGRSRPPRKARSSRRWAWLGRRGWMLALGLVAGAAGGQLAGLHRTVSYSATATLVVQSGASPTGPGSANDAQALAVTYAALLPRDQAVATAVAGSLHVPSSSVSHRFAVQAIAGTALLQVKYSASTAAKAIAGADAVARAVSATAPSSRAIASGSVDIVSLPTAAPPSDPLYKYALPLGAILGLLVGVGTALVAERVDRRVDDLEALGDATGCLVTTRPGGISTTELARTLERVSGRAPVTVVPMRPEQSSAADHLARDLSTVWRRGSSDSGRPVEVSPAFLAAPESLGSGYGVTVLMVTTGERLRAVHEVVGRLRLLDREPVWSVLVHDTGGPTVGDRGR